MADSKELKTAKSIFQMICNTLTKHDFQYTKDESALTIKFGVRGDDLPMDNL